MGNPWRKHAAAIRRVQGEGAVPVGALRGVAGVGPARLINWIVRGREGVHLDGYKERVNGRWYSSAAAVERFFQALKLKPLPAS